jgi:hypothetical protein
MTKTKDISIEMMEVYRNYYGCDSLINWQQQKDVVT